MDKEANLLFHIKAIHSKMTEAENWIMENDKLSVDDIVALRLKQQEYQNCAVWLSNIMKSKFPAKILVPENNNKKFIN